MTASKPKFVLTEVIGDVSNLTEPGRFIDCADHFNIPWRFKVGKSNDHFTFHLFCMKPQTIETWSVKTKYILSIASTKGIRLSKLFEYCFENDGQFVGCGSNVYIGWQEFVKDVVINDTVIIEAEVTLEETSGIDAPPKLRDFSQRTRSDVVLQVENEQFHVSKYTLAGQSSYFDTLFFGEFEEAKQKTITLKDINPQYFQLFLELIYHEQSLTDSNIEHVLHLTDMYDSKNAARHCEQFLIADSKHSLKTKLQIAARFKLEKLKVSNQKQREKLKRFFFL